MFDYAIGQYQKHPPSRRLLASWILSCLAHVSMVLILLEYPQLLRGGMNLWFRPPASGSQPTQSASWRNLAYVSKMDMPPLEVLKKYAYDWNQEKAKPEPKQDKAMGEGSQPPIRVNMRAIANEPPPLPKPRPDALTFPKTPPAPVTGDPAGPPVGDAAKAEPPADPKKPGTGNSAATAADVAPKQIPKGIGETPPPTPATVTAPPPVRPQPANAADQQNDQRLRGNVQFDAGGFPLAEYSAMIEQRVKENWSIASNLRGSKWSVTVFFYIYKDGHYDHAAVVASSGNTSMDNTALLAVLTSAPFPPLPKGFPAERVGARFVFIYNERQ